MLPNSADPNKPMVAIFFQTTTHDHHLQCYFKVRISSKNLMSKSMLSSLFDTIKNKDWNITIC